MADPISRTFMLGIPHGKLDNCIAQFENALRAIKPTPYRQICGLTFMDSLASTAKYLRETHERGAAATRIRAIYLEMNGFAFNTNRWFFSGFGYNACGTVFDLDWLSEWQYEADEDVTLSGMEPIQKVFRRLVLKEGKPLYLEIAETLAEHLVTARFMELIRAAHRVAKRRYPPLRGFPIFATAHDWETAILSK